MSLFQFGFASSLVETSAPNSFSDMFAFGPTMHSLCPATSLHTGEVTVRLCSFFERASLPYFVQGKLSRRDIQKVQRAQKVYSLHNTRFESNRPIKKSRQARQTKQILEEDCHGNTIEATDGGIPAIYISG